MHAFAKSAKTVANASWEREFLEVRAYYWYDFRRLFEAFSHGGEDLVHRRDTPAARALQAVIDEVEAN
jgi:hypothetical protein